MCRRRDGELAVIYRGSEKFCDLAAEQPRTIALGESPGKLGDEHGKLRSSDVQLILVQATSLLRSFYLFCAC